MKVVAAATAIIRGVLPVDALAGFRPVELRKGMLRTEKKTTWGGAIGLIEVSLAARSQD